MTVALIGRICDLLPKFGANALVLRGALQPAGAIATGSFQPLLNGADQFLIFIEPNGHTTTSLLRL